MSDIIDDACEREELHRQQSIANRAKPVFKQGKAGDCDFCGEWFSRLVGGACGFCRDKYKLP